MTGRDDERGFTLPELLVAITILGIIMVAIGAMISTAFRTTETVGDRLNASRGPKVVSRYWVPDVESAVVVNDDAPVCGAGGPGATTIARFAWTQEPSTIATVDADPATGPDVAVTWRRQDGARTKLLRDECIGGVPTGTTVVVADLDTATIESAGRVRTLRVTVPDKSRPEKTFEFSVAARQQVTP